MTQTTLLFLEEPDRLLLAMKKRGFGFGKWNGVGGKILKGETLPEAAIRETREEIGVNIAPEDLRTVGDLFFYYTGHSGWNQRCRVFFVGRWRGNPIETEEMRPRWFEKIALPFDEMWIDDKLWLPKVLSGKNVRAEFHFAEAGKTIERFSVKEID